jgi:hypothetical protein
MTEKSIFADDAELDEPVRIAVQAIRSDSITNETVAQLKTCLRGLGDTSTQPSHDGRARVIRYASMAAAAAILVGVTIWAAGLASSRGAFAEIVAAVGERPWVRVTFEDDAQSQRVVWYSPQKDISAWQNGDWIEYHDHALQVYYSYDVEEGVLYRVPEFTSTRRNRHAQLAIALQTLLRNGAVAEEPLDQLEFLGRDRSNMELVDQALERGEEDGEQRLEWRLTIRHRERPEELKLAFRIDPETKLPRSYRLEGVWEGVHGVEEAQLDYPEEGPADVYDLGVPRTAKLVDRVPTDNVQRIVNELRVGRQRMDNYRAIVVSQGGAWWNNDFMVLYRKGDKFRADELSFRDRWPHADRPDENADMAAWWKRRLDDFFFAPVYIVRGHSTYHIERSTAKNQADENCWIVHSVDETFVNTVPGEIYPPYWSRRPEFVCRPPMGIGRQDLEVSIEDDPQENAQKLVRLGIKREGRLPQAPGGRPIPDSYEYWLDPARGHAAVLWESAGTRYIIEEMARSPGGVWYATRFRHFAPGPNDELIEELFHVYVDFDVELPDSLFEVPEVGRTY